MIIKESEGRILTFPLILVFSSFAYVTVKDRLPRILVQIIDTLHKQKERILKDHDQVSELFTFMCGHTIDIKYLDCAFCTEKSPALVLHNSLDIIRLVSLTTKRAP